MTMWHYNIEYKPSDLNTLSEAVLSVPGTSVAGSVQQVVVHHGHVEPVLLARLQVGPHPGEHQHLPPQYNTPVITDYWHSIMVILLWSLTFCIFVWELTVNQISKGLRHFYQYQG